MWIPIRMEKKLLIFFLIQVHFLLISSERIFPGNPYSHREYLDPEGKYILEWVANPKKTDVIFNITAETLGYVALGFSKTGMMAKADMVVTGVDNKGKPYLSDYYTKMESRVPIEDIVQDWKFLDAWQNETHTSVRLSRAIDTCDRQDWPLNEGTLHILWAFGEDDKLDYHFKNKGSYPALILQPDLSPEVPSPQQSSSLSRSSSQRRVFSNRGRLRNSSSTPQQMDLDVWRLSATLNNTETSEPWCVFQKGPEIDKRKNIIGFSTLTVDEKVKRNLDRLVIYKCFPMSDPEGIRKLQQKRQDEPLTLEQTLRRSRYGSNNAELLEFSGMCKNATELYSFCTDIIYTWGNGGREIFLPKNVGIPFGAKDEYYLMESYLIPQMKNTSRDENGTREGSKNSEFDVDVDILVTESSRKYMAKVLKVGYEPMTPILIPPGSTNFPVYGHCPNDCTTKMIPRSKPLKVFGVSFDAGQSGKNAALYHFRNAFQIPVIAEEKNYDANFQEMQILQAETPVRQGDQLTVRCKFDNKTKISTSSQRPQDMPRCLAYLWYYQEIPLRNGSNPNDLNRNKQVLECTSKIHPSDFAIWIEENAPAEMKRNIDSPYIMDKLKKLRWSEFLRVSLSELYEFGRYRSSCGVSSNKQASSNNELTRPNNGTNSRSRDRSRTGEITVHPLRIEELPETPIGKGCRPTYNFPVEVAGPSSVSSSSYSSESAEPFYYGLSPFQPVIFG